jgi:hypothetical protein
MPKGVFTLATNLESDQSNIHCNREKHSTHAITVSIIMLINGWIRSRVGTTKIMLLKAGRRAIRRAAVQAFYRERSSLADEE